MYLLYIFPSILSIRQKLFQNFYIDLGISYDFFFVLNILNSFFICTTSFLVEVYIIDCEINQNILKSCFIVLNINNK